MSNPGWILAFDASCGRCRRISDVVARLAGDRLQVRPLAHPDVARWRERAFGENPPWAPTLLRVTAAGAVRGWTGPAVMVPMARLLGIGSTIEVLRGLGRLRSAEAGRGPGRRSRTGLLPAGAGAVLVGWLMLNGTTSAGGGGGDDEASRWVQENLSRLPQDYDAVIAHPVSYRSAIYAQLSPEARSGLWDEQFRRYQAAHPDLTPAQRQVLDTAMQFATDAANFAPGAMAGREQSMREQADAAFGRDQAARLFAVLGSDVPSSQLTPAGRRGCTCATTADWCDNSTHCNDANQCDKTGGCGFLWATECNGLCVN